MRPQNGLFEFLIEAKMHQFFILTSCRSSEMTSDLSNEIKTQKNVHLAYQNIDAPTFLFDLWKAEVNLKVLTQKFSALSPTIARSHFLLLIGFTLWLPLSQRGSSVLSPYLNLVSAAQRSSR